MKEQNYKKHIQGVPLDKLQEGYFEYDRAHRNTTLSEYAKKIRKEVNVLSSAYSSKCAGV